MFHRARTGSAGGYHAPGDKLRLAEVLLAAHHTLLAHGQAVREIRAAAQRPVTSRHRAWWAMRRSRRRIPRPTLRPRGRRCSPWIAPDMFNNILVDGPGLAWADTRGWAQLLCGDAARGAGAGHGTDLPAARFPGRQHLPRAGLSARAPTASRSRCRPPPGYPKTTQDYWPITPDVLYWGPQFFHERYRLPIVITENGHQNADVISLDGKVHDPQRIDYLHRHLRELRPGDRRWRATSAATSSGASRTTSSGRWAMRFAWGSCITDYPTQRRIPKDSAYWYGGVIRSNGVDL